VLISGGTFDIVAVLRLSETMKELAEIVIGTNSAGVPGDSQLTQR